MSVDTIPKSPRVDLLESFAKASALPKLGETVYLDEFQWQSDKNKRIENGVKNFKRKILGICGEQTIKSLEPLPSL